MDSFINWLVGRVKRNHLLCAFGSVGSYLAVDYFFDFFLYYLAIRLFGPVVGGGGVMLFGMVFDYWMLRSYDRYGKDVFGLEELKRLRDYTGTHWYRLWLAHILRTGNLVTVAAIAFYSNPCLATIYMRPRGERRTRMSLNDWKVFAISGLIEVVWIVLVYGFVQIEQVIRTLL